MNNIDEKYAWKFEDIFKSEAEVELEKEKVNEIIKDIISYKGKIGENADNLYEVYSKMEKAYEKLIKIDAYYTLKYHLDMGDAINLNNYKECNTYINQIESELAFITPEVSNIDSNVILKYLDENSKLKFKYGKLLQDILKSKKHILSDKEEILLAKYSEVFGSFENVFSLLSDVDFKFENAIDSNGKEFEVTHATYNKLLDDKDSILRKSAFNSMLNKYHEYINTIAEVYISSVKTDTITSKIRNYSSSLEKELEDDDSSIKVYENLINTVNDNLHINHKYMSLKKKLLGKSEFHMYDMFVDPLETEEQNLPYEECQNIILDVLAVYGKDYINVIKEAFNNNWIDVYERENKRSGGYSMGVYGVHPYILLSYKNNIESMNTVIHELGHTMHSHYSMKAQNYFNSHYTILVAEVASTVNEILLNEYLIKKENDKIKKASLINNLIGRIRGALVHQTMYAEFEQQVHENTLNGISMSADDLCDIYYNLNKKYSGEDVIVDENIKYGWARIPHFYRSFYVYKYATGISSAICIAKNILDKKTGFVEKYIDMLKKGGSENALELLRNIEVDLETKEPVERAFKYYSEKINELEKLI